MDDRDEPELRAGRPINCRRPHDGFAWLDGLEVRHADLTDPHAANELQNRTVPVIRVVDAPVGELGGHPDLVTDADRGTNGMVVSARRLSSRCAQLDPTLRRRDGQPPATSDGADALVRETTSGLRGVVSGVHPASNATTRPTATKRMSLRLGARVFGSSRHGTCSAR